MTYLLDTHTFLWFINDDPLLSPIAKRLIESPENAVYLSIASVWEMAIKVSLGKLEVPSPFTDFIDAQVQENSISILAIKTSHAGIVTNLPFHHRDPFDRLIIAQARSEGYTLISRDEIFDRYGVERRW